MGIDGGKKIFEVMEGGEKYGANDLVFEYYWAEVSQNGQRVSVLPGHRYINLMPPELYRLPVD